MERNASLVPGPHEKLYSWAVLNLIVGTLKSEMDSPSVELIKKYYDEGKLTKDQGAIGMDLSEEKLGFCLLLKSDGNGLYATKDVLLAQEKFKEFDIQKISTSSTFVKAFISNKFLKF